LRLFKGQQQGLYVFTKEKQFSSIPAAIHSANQHPHGSVTFRKRIMVEEYFLTSNELDQTNAEKTTV